MATFVGQRMSIPVLFERELRGETELVAVVVSWPHGMADEVRNAVSKLGKKVPVKLTEESFSWYLWLTIQIIFM